MNRPITIDGTPAMTLVRKRNNWANGRVRPYSFRYTAPRMPSGTAITVAITVITTVPMIAAFIPGPGRRGDNWMSFVNLLGNEPDTIDHPLVTTVMSTSNSTKPTRMTASAISAVMTTFFVRRLPAIPVRSAASSRVFVGNWAVTVAMVTSPAHASSHG